MFQTKTDNKHITAKLLLRRYFLDKYHAGGGVVLDCCQATGRIWHILRAEYPHLEYVGADIMPQKTATIKIDSSRLLMTHGWPYTVVDIDTYGEPWKHYANLCQTIAGPVTVFLTLGLIRVQGGVTSNLIRAALHIPRETPTALATAAHAAAADMLLFQWLNSNTKIVEIQEALPKGKARYIGIRLDYNNGKAYNSDVVQLKSKEKNTCR